MLNEPSFVQEQARNKKKHTLKITTFRSKNESEKNKVCLNDNILHVNREKARQPV